MDIQTHQVLKADNAIPKIEEKTTPVYKTQY